MSGSSPKNTTAAVAGAKEVENSSGHQIVESSDAGTNCTSAANATTATGPSDDEDWSGYVDNSLLEHAKSGRSKKRDANRRRRTIIVEKKNGTFGFTLQSYGIHYKKDQEIEMVTYVDYVDYDGPAFRAGMREGDVILSVNGHEMDKADHKTLVNFIKKCDTRMRMVVSFEDCIRKVELHMRYIELQRALQSRLSELERLCERERSILQGRWKTHSLPARKKAANSLDVGNPEESLPPSKNLQSTYTSYCCRPASSTEHLLYYNVYADGRSYLIPRNSTCLVELAASKMRRNADRHYFLTNAPIEHPKNHSSTSTSRCSSGCNYQQLNGLATSKSQTKSHYRQQPKVCHLTSSRNLCVACIASAANNKRHSHHGTTTTALGNELDAYDLASSSPCCDSNCVPNRKQRKEKQQHQQRHHQKTANNKQYVDQKRVHNCSASCTTSLSSDTLYHDPVHQQHSPCIYRYVKPKSWDNLTTKAFGGYGFGYGYLDCAEKPHKTTSSHHHRSNRSSKSTQSCSSNVPRRSGSSVSTSSTKHHSFVQSGNKSTECLLAQGSSANCCGEHLAVSCECLEVGPNSHSSGKKSTGRHRTRIELKKPHTVVITTNNNSDITRL